MGFVFIAQTAQDLDRFLLGRFADRHRLEAALESGVLLDVLAVFLERRCADNLQVAARERGLEDVRGVRRALGRAGADERVHLVDKEDHVAGFRHLVDRIADALLEVAAVFRAGHHAGQVKGNDPLAAQELRHLAGGDFQRKALRDRGFAHARLADQAGIILGAAAEDLDHALDLLLPPDDGIDPALSGKLGQVTAELGQRRRVGGVLFRLAALAGGCAAAAERLAQILHQILRLHAELGKDLRCRAGALLQNADQEMLGADIGMPHPPALQDGSINDIFGAGRKVVGGKHGRRADADAAFDHGLHLAEADLARMQRRIGHAAVFRQQAEQDVLAADVGMAEVFGRLNRVVQRFVCFLGKTGESVHSSNLLWRDL